jgi:hypothetical protein
MQAEVGDHIVIETAQLDAHRRQGEVVEVIGQDDRRHYRVRWQDGHESVYFPGPDCRVTTEPDRKSRSPRS